MLGDLPRGKSQTALAWGLRGRFHQCPKRDKNGDNDLRQGVRGFGCLCRTGVSTEARYDWWVKILV